MASIKLATEEDLIELSKVKHNAWLTTYRGIYPDEKLDNYDINEHAEKFRKLLNDSNVCLYCIYDKKELVGFFSYGKGLKYYKDFKYYLRQLYIIQKAQGRGIGKQVFAFIRGAMVDLQQSKFFTNCNIYNKNALAFYEKMGGKITKIEREGSDLSCHQAYIEYEV